MYEESKTGIKKDEPGWHTTSINRWDIFGELKELIDSGNIIVPSFEGLRQLLDVITDREKKLRPEARKGANDDYPIALGIAVQMKQYVPKTSNKVVVVPSGWSVGG